MYKKIWEELWTLLGYMGVIAIAVFLIILIVVDKKPIRYTLGSDTNSGYPCIIKEIDWAIDEKIYPSRFTTDEELIKMVDSLNTQLRRHENRPE